MDPLGKYLVDMNYAMEDKYIPRVSDALAAAMDNYVPFLRREGASARIPLSSRVKIVTQITDLVIESMTLSTEAVRKDMEAKADENLVQRIISDYFDKAGARKITQIIQTTEKQVSEIVSGGLRRGAAEEAVYRDLVNKIPDIASGRAQIITQTEAHSAGQFASQAIAERSNIPLTKIWNTVRDDRTRGGPGRTDAFNHWVMHGVTVSLGRQFPVPMLTGGVQLLEFPGDPNGSAGNVINCRCVQTYTRTG